MSEILGRNIARTRKEAGLRQRHLAEAMGVGKSYVSMIESGHRRPTDEQLATIARVLNKSVSELADFGLSTAEDVLNALLLLEASGLGVVPKLDNDGDAFVGIDKSAPHASKMDAALKEWDHMRHVLESGEITQADYDAWRGSHIIRANL